ncbi:MAG: Uma2 family endonuclease [Myxococcota bacterium]
MVAARAPSFFTEKEYLALEAVAESRHEYSGGLILAMAGAEFAHNQIAQNVRAELTVALLERPCHILSSDQRVKVEATSEYYYPDVIVTCQHPVLVDPRPQSLLNPEVIVEVLSTTTGDFDHGTKWLAYRTIPTLTDYVMVSSTRRELEHYQRAPDGTWASRTLVGDGKCTLTNGVQLELAKMYRLVPNL